MKQETLAIKAGIFRVESNSDYLAISLVALVVGLLCFDLYVLIYGISNGINEWFGFRQSQTALTAYWLAKEPHGFAYLTPMLGAPWSFPFEFPVYQWLIVLLMKVGTPLVAAGRIISFAAFVGCLVPLKMMALDFKVPNRAFLITAAIYLASPFYVFWARSLMIDTLALLFSLCWLAGFLRSRNESSATLWLATLGFGVLAVLTKSTTFLGIGPIAGVIYIIDAVAWLRRRKLADIYGLIARGALCLIPLLVGAAWVIASDRFKSPNAFGPQLNSTALMTWNFGTLAQRLQFRDTIFNSLKETFGYIGLVIPLLIAFDFSSNRYRLAIIGAAGGYLTAFLLFTNLHIVHTYYQTANAIFICVAVGLSIASMLDKGRRKTAALALGCVLVSQFCFFYEYFWWPVKNDNIGNPVTVAAQAARDVTKSNESLLIFGDDWSSMVPFYSERKSLAVPGFTPEPLLQKILTDPQSFLGDVRLGAIVDCRAGAPTHYDPSMDKAVDAFMANRHTMFSNDRCRIVSPQAMGPS